MKKLFSLAILGILGLAIVGGGAFAQTSRDLTINVNLAPWLDLNLDRDQINFADVAPAIVNPPPPASLPADSTVSIRVFAVKRAAQILSLVVTCPTDLADPAQPGVTIPISNVSWTVAGNGFAAGSMAQGASTPCGSWDGTVVVFETGVFTYAFNRDYLTQGPGSYTATVTYTLSAT